MLQSPVWSVDTLQPASTTYRLVVKTFAHLFHIMSAQTKIQWRSRRYATSLSWHLVLNNVEVLAPDFCQNHIILFDSAMT